MNKRRAQYHNIVTIEQLRHERALLRMKIERKEHKILSHINTTINRVKRPTRWGFFSNVFTIFSKVLPTALNIYKGGSAILSFIRGK